MTANEQNDISVKRIELAVYRDNLPGNEYSDYSNGRGVCGLVVAIGGKSTYRLGNGAEVEIAAGEAALLSSMK